MTSFWSSEAASGAVGPRSRRRDSASRRALTAASSSASRGPLRDQEPAPLEGRLPRGHGGLGDPGARQDRLDHDEVAGRPPARWPRPAPTTSRSRGLRLGMLPPRRRTAFPAGPEAELLLVLGLGHRRGELDPLEPRPRLSSSGMRALAASDWPVSSTPWRSMVKRLQPGIPRAGSPSARAGPAAPGCGRPAPPPARPGRAASGQLGGQALDRLRLRIEPADLLRQTPEVSLGLDRVRESQGERPAAR